MAACIQGCARPRHLLGLALLALAAAPGAAQQQLRGVGADRAPSAASAAPDAVLVIDGEEVPASVYARWLIEEVGPPLVREFAVGWALEREAGQGGLAPDEAVLEARLAEELRVRIDGAFHGRREEWLEELTRLGRSEAGHRRQRKGELRPLLAATALAASARVVPEEKVARDWELLYGPRGRAFDLELLKLAVLVEAPADGVWSRDAFERQIEAARARGLERARELRAPLRRARTSARSPARPPTTRTRARPAAGCSPSVRLAQRLRRGAVRARAGPALRAALRARGLVAGARARLGRHAAGERARRTRAAPRGQRTRAGRGRGGLERSPSASGSRSSRACCSRRRRAPPRSPTRSP